jgi:hypothetical protein
MNIERLTMLQTLLATVGNGKWYGGEPFEYHKFLGFKWPKKSKVNYNIGYWFSKRKNGYASCAIGHAMLDKNFQALGFTHGGNLMTPEFEGSKGFAAVCAFFDINQDTATLLFSPMSYSTDCWKDPLFVTLRLDWLLHNAHGNEDKFKADIKTYGKEVI